MTRLTDTVGGVTLGGRMSCSRCYTEMTSWEIRVPALADVRFAAGSLEETVSQLTGAMLARITACSMCAELDAAEARRGLEAGAEPR